MGTLENPSRRQLIGQFSGAVFAGVSLRASSSASAQTVLSDGTPRPRSAPAGDEEFWSFISKQFMLPPGTIYLRNGTTGAQPKTVFDAEVRYQRLLAEDPSARGQLQQVIDSTIRQKAATLIGADLEETALALNTTEGLNTVAHGLALKTGDQVLTTNHEHPSMREAWRLRSKRDGIEVIQVTLPSPLTDPAAFLNSIERAITSRTKVIAVPHIPTTTGLILPARDICALARSKGILSLLDGAHAIGQIKFNVKELGCDFYACSPHKWLNAPLGNGIFYVRREVQDRLWPLTGDSNWDTFGDARKYTAVGCRAFATKMALEVAIDFANSIGIERIEARQRELMTYFRRKLLTQAGVEALVPDGMYCAQSAFRFRVPITPAAWEKHGGATILARTGNEMRIDVAYFISRTQLDRAVDVFQATQKQS